MLYESNLFRSRQQALKKRRLLANYVSSGLPNANTDVAEHNPIKPRTLRENCRLSLSPCSSCWRSKGKIFHKYFRIWYGKTPSRFLLLLQKNSSHATKGKESVVFVGEEWGNIIRLFLWSFFARKSQKSAKNCSPCSKVDRMTAIRKILVRTN